MSGSPEAPTGIAKQKTIYGADDLSEYYEIQDLPIQRVLAKSIVALAYRGMIDFQSGSAVLRATTADNFLGLCPGERFAEQPAMAICTGVLIDWDLVLTAYHCAHAIPLKDLIGIFGFYYVAKGELAGITQQDIRDFAQIVAEESGDADATERIDYAILRLSTPVDSLKSPAVVQTNPARIGSGEQLIGIGFGMGVPAKIDLGGHVEDPRTDKQDFFTANTDTFHGSSGGGAFGTDLALLGVLARGGPDYLLENGCNMEMAIPDSGAAAQEQYTYAARALHGLCQATSNQNSLCRPDCIDQCEAQHAPTQTRVADGSCDLVPRPKSSRTRSVWNILSFLVFVAAERKRRRS